MPFHSLPTDALVSILCRCPAADHPALWKTCRTFRSALDSDAYKSERAASGWAEVETRLIPGRELYDRDNPDGPMYLSDPEEGEDIEEKKRRRREEELEEYYCDLGRKDADSYGCIDIRHDIKVDGVVTGSVTMILVPREPWGEMFHERCDAHSQELTEVGWGLCDARGRPKVKSIRDADDEGEAIDGGFLHIKTVRVHSAYRAGDCTEVVARAVRSALEAPELEDRWTLATAISDYNVYLTREERQLLRQLSNERWQQGGGEDGNGPSEEEERIASRQQECKLLDARTFLRVGYRQIPETVGAEKDGPVWLFALPRFLEEPMITAAEAADVKLHEPPDLPPEPSGADNELLELIKKSSNDIRISLDSLKAAKRESAKEAQQLQGLLEEKDAKVAEMSNLLQGDKPEHISEGVWEGYHTNLREVREILAGFRAMRDESIQRASEAASSKRREVNERIKTTIREARTLVNEKGASVRKSFAIHCASRLRIAEFVDSLLELVPSREKDSAISELDSNGCAPLHCVMMGTPELDDADEYRALARHLIHLGADTNVTDAFGRTALGQHRFVTSSRLDFSSVLTPSLTEYGPEAWRAYHNEMEAVLMPTRGETDADRDAMPTAYDDSDQVDWDNQDDWGGMDVDDNEGEDGNANDGNDNVQGIAVENN